MTWNAYIALTVRDRNYKPVYHVVRRILIANGEVMKREELVDEACNMTGISKDEMSAHLNGVLRQLEKGGYATHVKHGYWVATKQ